MKTLTDIFTLIGIVFFGMKNKYGQVENRPATVTEKNTTEAGIEKMAA